VSWQVNTQITKYGDEFVRISYSSKYSNISKDHQNICGDFIFTAVGSDFERSFHPHYIIGYFCGRNSEYENKR
jgi:hypothetical protein